MRAPQIGQGAESVVFMVEPFIPIECVAKIALKNSKFTCLLIENNYLRIVENEEFTCKIFEEIVIFDKKLNKITGILAINEKAESDID